MRPEVAAALPGIVDRLKFTLTHGARVFTAPTTPKRMARRIAWAKAHRFADPHAVKAPVLLVTGEPGLDRVVPVDVTRRYLDQFEAAQHVVLEHTGHIGLVTRPDAFAGTIERFVNGVRLSA
jgi:pimeloyl-ACP methyl ester carboxylesterase